MINWIILGIFIFLALLYLKVEHYNKRVKLIFMILVCILLYFSAYAVFSANNSNLKSPKGIIQAVYTYVGYLGGAFSNLWTIKTDVGGLVGNAVKINQTKLKT